ncbi:MAG: DUF922 domain-containing protein, partial [Bacteroidota bacterium]
ENDVWILDHEQRHFDISEIYARKMRKAVYESLTRQDNLQQRMAEIYNDFMRQCSEKQDEYDSEVYYDSKRQEAWNTWVANELEALEAYKDTTFELRKL